MFPRRRCRAAAAPQQQIKCLLQQLKPPHTHFACLDSRAEVLEILVGNPAGLLYADLQSPRSLDSHTDARAAQTALKRSMPFPLPTLYTCSWLCCQMLGCPWGQCQPEHPLGPQGQRGDNFKELPSPSPWAPWPRLGCSFPGSCPHSCSCTPAAWPVLTHPQAGPLTLSGEKGTKEKGRNRE